MSVIHVILKCAMSLDGFLDDGSPRRLVLSGPEDLDRVDEVRASCDAVLVGANTVRRDNPRLLIRSPERQRLHQATSGYAHPIKVTWTRSGDLPPDAPFFTTGDCPKWVYCRPSALAAVSTRLGPRAEVRPAASERELLIDLSARGIRRLLIEGGSNVATAFLAADLVDELQLSVAPFFVGEAAAPRFVQPGRFPFTPERPLHLLGVEQLGNTALLTVVRDVDRHWLREAVDLSRRCVPSPGAFSVGAVLVSASGKVLATGYSREAAPSEHAEETALRKAAEAGLDPAGGTVYSSLEPCSVRLSGKKPCTERLLEAGVRRVVFALAEPPVFVRCTGAETLRQAGVEVTVLDELAQLVREVNRHLLPPEGTNSAPPSSNS